MNRRTFLLSLCALSAMLVTGTEARAAGSKILVAYFSAFGNTREVAGTIAKTLNAGLYEIRPEKPYTREDLDWHDKTSRSSVEMGDEKSRPGIAGKLPDLSAYDTVFIGYPIWWGIAPRIVQTFVEGCDLDGKTVLPFCTSGGSPFAQSADLLAAAAPRARWMPGRRLAAGTGSADITAWAREAGVR